MSEKENNSLSSQEFEYFLWSGVYSVHALLQIFETGSGFYKLLKYKQSKLLQGPQLVLKSLYFAVWIIYGYVAKDLFLTIPVYIAIALLQMLGYLLMIWQWDFIVYYFTVVINTAWYMRQTTLEDLKFGCTIISVLLMLAPLFQLYKAIRNVDRGYISKYACIIGLFDGLFFLAYCLHENNIPAATAAGLKIVTIIALDITRRNLQSTDPKKQD